MNHTTIDLMLRLIKKLDMTKQNKKLSNDEKIEEVMNIFNQIPIDIKAQLERMQQESIKGINLPKDFKAEGNGRFIESESLDSSDYDDLLITISGNFLEDQREKLTNAIVYKLNH